MIQVHVIATLGNSPNEILNCEYWDFIGQFLQSENHLRDNIAASDLEHQSTKSLWDNKYVHTVSIILDVKTARLWESPAKYIQKHIGLDNYWTKWNGKITNLLIKLIPIIVAKKVDKYIGFQITYMPDTDA